LYEKKLVYSKRMETLHGFILLKSHILLIFYSRNIYPRAASECSETLTYTLIYEFVSPGLDYRDLLIIYSAIGFNPTYNISGTHRARLTRNFFTVFE
jgi:hypothetical protein